MGLPVYAPPPVIVVVSASHSPRVLVVKPAPVLVTPVRSILVVRPVPPLPVYVVARPKRKLVVYR